MKHYCLKIVKLQLIFIFSILLFNSCQEEEDLVSEPITVQDFKIKRISFSTFKEMAKDKMDLKDERMLAKLDSNNIQITTLSDSYVKGINEEEVIVYYGENYISYTFSTETKDYAKTTNFVVTVGDDYTKEQYIQYDEDIENPTEINPDSGIGIVATGVDIYPCAFSSLTVTVDCSCHEVHAEGGCTHPETINILVVTAYCIQDNGGSINTSPYPGVGNPTGIDPINPVFTPLQNRITIIVNANIRDLSDQVEVNNLLQENQSIISLIESLPETYNAAIGYILKSYVDGVMTEEDVERNLLSLNLNDALGEGNWEFAPELDGNEDIPSYDSVEEAIEDDYGLINPNLEDGYSVEDVAIVEGIVRSSRRVRFTRFLNSGLKFTTFVENANNADLDINQDDSSFVEYGFASIFWDFEVDNPNNIYYGPYADFSPFEPTKPCARFEVEGTYIAGVNIDGVPVNVKIPMKINIWIIAYPQPYEFNGYIEHINWQRN